MYEMVWSGQDKRIKAFVKETETKGLYWYEIFVCGHKALVGAMDRDGLSDFLPKLKGR